MSMMSMAKKVTFICLILDDRCVLKCKDVEVTFSFHCIIFIYIYILRNVGGSKISFKYDVTNRCLMVHGDMKS